MSIYLAQTVDYEKGFAKGILYTLDTYSSVYNYVGLYMYVL